jgi:antitoxin ParD1/3/4
MTIQLTPQSEALIRRQVASGRYATVDEALDAAVRLLDERDRRLQALRAEVAVGLEQVERGELIDYTPDTMDRLMQEADEPARRGLPVKDAVKP